MIWLNTIICGDVFEYLRKLPEKSIHAVVTSPPYYGQRDYGMEGQIGLENSPQAYIDRLVSVFAEIWRVLRDDGVVWLNLGDSYYNYRPGTYNDSSAQGFYRKTTNNIRDVPSNSSKRKRRLAGYREKSRMMIPAKVAIALQESGWIIRDEIIWHKTNPMPASVKDRTTGAHEMVYFLTKLPQYWSDFNAIRESHLTPSNVRNKRDEKYTNGAHHAPYGSGEREWNHPLGRNKRSVWSIAVEPSEIGHYAMFPTKLIEPMILAGCPQYTCPVCGQGYKHIVKKGKSLTTVRLKRDETGSPSQLRSVVKNNRDRYMSGRVLRKWKQEHPDIDQGWIPNCSCLPQASVPGIVLDPFMGSGTTALVARRLGRQFAGCELNPKYATIANNRLEIPYMQPFFTP